MQTAGIHEVQTVFLLLLSFVIIFALLARRLNTPYPIVLVIAGLLLGFVPGIPTVTLDPDIIFLVVLPPLLYSAAWNTSWREFRYNLINVSMLAFGLVGFTVLGVTLAAPRVLNGFDWRLGFVLGAVVATTDAIAATSIAKRIGLPHGIVDILEGESLLNDATGLLALEFGLSIVEHGQTPSIASGLSRLVWLTVGGLAVGIVIGYLVDLFERHVEYSSIEIILSLLVPYATYLAADAINSSGVLAVVACGLFLSRRSAEFFSPKVRLQSTAVWSSLSFALNGLTFILIGLQLPSIRAGIKGQKLSGLLIDGAVFSGLLILLRLLWVFPGTYIANALRKRTQPGKVAPYSRRQVFVVGWTGMRGVIALAAALSLPVTLADGTPFRNGI
ncbi:MAG: cation:proton antiporter [Acidobacteriota bacterium]|nr:cation:proton antiporter [Acidobacteriota bacterium]MDQ2840602.1 cation:proton antiporter [Acidobacteriota bacterium]